MMEEGSGQFDGGTRILRAIHGVDALPLFKLIYYLEKGCGCRIANGDNARSSIAFPDRLWEPA